MYDALAGGGATTVDALNVFPAFVVSVEQERRQALKGITRELIAAMKSSMRNNTICNESVYLGALTSSAVEGWSGNVIPWEVTLMLSRTGRG